MEDEVIECVQCKKEFIYTLAEQKRMLAKGFDAPRRCPQCRKKKEKLEVSVDSWKDKGRRKGSRKKHHSRSQEHWF